MEKLKDLEDTLATTMELNSKKDEQATLDREIIGFLDAKTQEYEISLKKCVKECAAYRSERDRLHQEHAAKMTVSSTLSDCGVAFVYLFLYVQIIEDMIGLLTDEKRDLETQLRVRHDAFCEYLI